MESTWMPINRWVNKKKYIAYINNWKLLSSKEKSNYKIWKMYINGKKCILKWVTHAQKDKCSSSSLSLSRTKIQIFCPFYLRTGGSQACGKRPLRSNHAKGGSQWLRGQRRKVRWRVEVARLTQRAAPWWGEIRHRSLICPNICTKQYWVKMSRLLLSWTEGWIKR